MSVRRGYLARLEVGADTFEGRIAFGNHNLKLIAVRSEQTGPKAPEFRLLHKDRQIEVGAMFRQTPNAGGADFFSIVLEGPEFRNGIERFAAFESAAQDCEPWMNAGDRYDIVWRARRPQPSEAEGEGASQ